MYRRALRNIKDAKAVRDLGRYKCGLYASSIAFDGEQGEKMRKVVEEIRPYVDEHYWLPLYSMSGAAQEHGMAPKAGNPADSTRCARPLPCWSVFTEGHITAAGMLSACCFGNGADDASSPWPTSTACRLWKHGTARATSRCARPTWRAT